MPENELDKLLEELQQEYSENTQAAQSKSNSAIDNLLTEIKTEPINKNTENKFTYKPINSLNQESVSDNLFASVKQEYQEQEKLLAAKQEEEKLNQLKQEREKEQRRQQKLKELAKEWLKKLDPHSDEGLWFEEFSYAYESKLDAAIDYLQALRDSRFIK